MKTIEEVKEFFSKDRFAVENGAEIEEIGDGYAKCSMLMEEHHMNAVGAVMGGVYFTLADFAFAVATNWEGEKVVSLNSTITYLEPAKGEKLIAEACCVKEGKKTNCYRIDVNDEYGHIVATVMTTGYRI